jgi:hypothetical protein
VRLADRPRRDADGQAEGLAHHGAEIQQRLEGRQGWRRAGIRERRAQLRRQLGLDARVVEDEEAGFG